MHQLLTGSGPGYHNLVHSDVGCTLDAEDCYAAASWNSDNSFPCDQQTSAKSLLLKDGDLQWELTEPDLLGKRSLSLVSDVQ